MVFFFYNVMESLKIYKKQNLFLIGGFKGCSSLTKISIPSSVTSIGESAFEGCPPIIEY